MRVIRRHLIGRTPLSGLILLALLFIPIVSSDGHPNASSPAPAPALASPSRIISLSPATTEILFVLGLGPRVVGVTRYCDFPPETASILKVGGYVDPNYEAITALKPDLAIVLTSHRDLTASLEKLKIPTLTTPHETIADVHEAIRLIGHACAVPDRAASLSESLKLRAETVVNAVKNAPRPGILICIGRDYSSGQLSGMYMAGQDGFYDEIIRMAGGRNACSNTVAAFPLLSAESVITINPDVIIDLTGVPGPATTAPDAIARQWDRLHTVAAVRNRRVYTISDNHALRPGPRYVDFSTQLARLVHPEAFLEAETPVVTEQAPRKAESPSKISPETADE